MNILPGIKLHQSTTEKMQEMEITTKPKVTFLPEALMNVQLAPVVNRMCVLYIKCCREQDSLGAKIRIFIQRGPSCLH